ncbi:MAG: hypothetical protein JO061_01955 [Acidobacteriaceae bacterium]|nr:hypothetical protein [Acidobacteriaceae bacterium]
MSTVTEPTKRPSLFEHLFLRYGAGSGLLKPLTGFRCYNAFAWTVIGLGIAGWIFGLWFLRTHFPE